MGTSKTHGNHHRLSAVLVGGTMEVMAICLVMNPARTSRFICTKIIDCNVESIVTTSTLLEEAISFTSFHS